MKSKNFNVEFLRALYNEVNAEIDRSIDKHGPQDHVTSLDPKLIDRDPQRMSEGYEVPTENRAKANCDLAFKRGELTQAHILTEELCEAIGCMKDEKAMRKELIQVIATAVKWIHAIDLRENISA